MSNGDYAGGYGSNRTSTGTTFDKKKGWGASGTLTTGNKLKTVSMQANFPETGTYTAQFTRGGNPASNNPIFAEAIVTWACEGNFVSRRITIADGVAVTGVGQAVKVIMYDNTIPLKAGTPPFDPLIPEDYGVSVQVSYGNRGTDEQPPTLIPIQADGGDQPDGPAIFSRDGRFTVTNGNFVLIPIPQDAGVKSVFITVVATDVPPPAEDLLVAAHVYAGTSLKAYDPRIYTEWVPVTPGTDHIQVSSSAINPVDFSVTFGIEG